MSCSDPSSWPDREYQTQWWPYAAGLVLSLAALAGLFPADWYGPIPYGLLILLPVGVICGQRLLAPHRYRLTRAGLQLGAGRCVPYAGLTLLQRGPWGALTCQSGRRRWCVPGWLRGGAASFREELVFRVQEAARAGFQAPEPVGAMLPESLEHHLLDLRRRRPGQPVWLARGPVDKRPLVCRWLGPVLSLLFLSGAFSVAASGDLPTVGRIVVLSILGGCAVLLLTVAIVRRRRARPEFLLLSVEGVAMVSRRLTGELSWEQVSALQEPRVSLGRPRCWKLITDEGCGIEVEDRFDAPLTFLLPQARKLWRAAWAPSPASEHPRRMALAPVAAPAAHDQA